MDDLDRRKELRRQKALDRLRTNFPRCVVCGLDDPHCLELHHIAGRSRDDETVIVSRNHHRQLSDPQKDHEYLAAGVPADFDTFVHFVLGFLDLLLLLGGQLRERLISLRDAGGPRP